MTLWLKQSTAATIVLGPFVDETDGRTAEVALTLTQADIRLSKNGAAFAQKSEATSAAHMENGYYSVPIDATDTGTLGRLKVAVNEAGALPVWATFMVAPANVWDSLFGADLLQVDATQLLGTAFATPTVAGVMETDTTHWNGSAVATPTVAGVPGVDATHWRGTAIGTPDFAGHPRVTIRDGSGPGEIATTAGAIDTVGAVTGNVGGNVVGSVGSVVAGVDVTLIEGVDATSQLAAGATAGAPTAAAIADAVWDEVRAGHVAAGSFGEGVLLSATAVDAIWDELIVIGISARMLMRGFASSLLGELAIGEDGEVTIRDVLDTKTVITMETTAIGERLAVTLDLT